MDFKLLDYVIRMIPIDTIVNILGLFATFFGALAGALIAGIFTLIALKADLKDRRESSNKEKEEYKKREDKKIKARLLFEMDNLMMFNHEVADNIYLNDNSKKMEFLKNFVLYDKKNTINLTLLELEKFRYLLKHNYLSYEDKENEIYEKFVEEYDSNISISLPSNKLKKVKAFLNNTKNEGEMCMNVNKNSILRLKDFSINLQDLSHLLYILNTEELNVLYGIKQTIKIIIENAQETDKDFIYKVDKYYFLHNILINQLNVMCKNIL
ncbi:hypothetical protein I2P67_002614 [Staphylococcus aureus]|nr:hypothetical protein [Staphylococcus aureus]